MLLRRSRDLLPNHSIPKLSCVPLKFDCSLVREYTRTINHSCPLEQSLLGVLTELAHYDSCSWDVVLAHDTVSASVTANGRNVTPSSFSALAEVTRRRAFIKRIASTDIGLMVPVI